MKKKLKSISRLKKDADRVFSLWVRNRDGKCYTCPSTQNLQAGHFVSRSYLALRYDERNVHAQCVGCNVFKSGNMAVYAFRLTEQYGATILKELQIFKLGRVSIPRVFYQNIIKKYALSNTSDNRIS